MGEKYDLESSQVKRVAKQAQQVQSRKIQGTFCGPNEDQNASFEKCRDRAKQRAPRAVRPLPRFFSSSSFAAVRLLARL